MAAVALDSTIQVDLQIIRITPGDKLVVECPQKLTVVQRLELRDQVEDWGGRPTLILDDGKRLRVLHTVSHKPRNKKKGHKRKKSRKSVRSSLTYKHAALENVMKEARTLYDKPLNVSHPTP